MEEESSPSIKPEVLSSVNDSMMGEAPSSIVPFCQSLPSPRVGRSSLVGGLVSEAERGPRGRKLFTVFSILVFLVSISLRFGSGLRNLLSHFLFLFLFFFFFFIFLILFSFFDINQTDRLLD